MLDFQRVTVLAGLTLLVFACGSEFTGSDPATGGAAGQAAGGASAGSGSAVGGDDTPDGGSTTANGGRGGVTGGSAGKPSLGGTGGGGGVGGSVVETPPIPLEGLELWFDAGVGVTESNGVVSSWKDQSGHQRDALQTALNYRPKLDASGLKGKPALAFTGDDYLKLPTLAADFSQGVTIFAMGQHAGASDGDSSACSGIFEASNGSEIDDIHLGFWQGAVLYEVSNDYLQTSDFPLVFGEPQLLAAVHQASNAVQVRRNSNALGEDNFALPAGTERESVFIGRTEYSDCVPYLGTVAELIVYSRAVSDAELIDIESYLQKKWDCCAE